MLPGVSSERPGSAYDAVIIGSGIQGLALAYELAGRGVTRVAVLERSWPGGGASGRNGELIRSAFSSSAWTNFFELSRQRWCELSAELRFNLLHNTPGYLVVASTDEQLDRCRADHHAQRELGIRTSLLDADQVLELVPAFDPEVVRGAILQEDAGWAHHDASVWAYLRGAARRGVEIHAGVEVTDVLTRGGSVVGVVTTGGAISAPVVVNAAGGAAPQINALAGVDIPLTTNRLEMLVTEPLRPFLPTAVAALELLAYAHQTSRGEFVGGTELLEPDVTSSLASTYALLRDMAQKFVRLLPVLAGARVLRQWAGTVSQGADLAPVVGPVPDLDGFYVTCGWVYGFMGAPAAGVLLAEAIVNGNIPPALAPFEAARLSGGRFIAEGSLVVPTGRGR